MEHKEARFRQIATVASGQVLYVLWKTATYTL